ncbi:MAG: PCRF domain-containing protein [Tepidisphaeraceae bacterium]
MTLFDVPNKLKRRAELEAKMGEGDFWNDPEAAKPIISELKIIKATTEPIDAMMAELADCRAMFDLGTEAGDQDTLEEADKELARLEKRGDAIELQALLDGKPDPLNCFVTIQAGEGGTEAQDWADILSRMYLHFWEHRGWDVSEVDRQDGEQAGIKSVTYHVKGEYAFGYMRTKSARTGSSVSRRSTAKVSG